MKRIFLFVSMFALVMATVLPLYTEANTGVSVNTGKIILDKAIIPGGKYDLPSIEVKNVGDKQTAYVMSVEHNEVQSQGKPDASWFDFDPGSFTLGPGESKLVKVSVVAPAGVASGDYFAYLEANSVQTDANAHSTVSGAAATKLYFSVAPAGKFIAAFYGLASFIRTHGPWSYIVLWALAIIILIALIKRVRHAHALATKKPVA